MAVATENTIFGDTSIKSMVLFLKSEVSCAETSGYVVVDEVSFFVQRLIRLSYNEIVLFVCSQIYHLISNLWIRCVSLIDHTVRCFNKAVLVYSRISLPGS